MDRRRITRWAAPVAFLAAITIGALVVRAGLDQGNHHSKTSTSTVTSKKSHGHRHRKRRVRMYTVQSGDTFASIAAKTGTTVVRLEHLNPGVDPGSLRVGQKIRVQ